MNFENESLLFLLLVWLDTIFRILFFFHLWVPYCFCLVFSFFTPPPTLAIWSGFRLLPAHCLTEGMKAKSRGIGAFPVVFLCKFQALLCHMSELRSFKFRIHCDRNFPNLLSALSKQYVLLSGRCLLSEKSIHLRPYLLLQN